VSAFGRVKPMGCSPDATCPDSHWWIKPPPGFPRSLDGLRKGCYNVSGKHRSFFLGYSGYDDWRCDLSLMAHGIEPEVIWRRPAAYRRKAFVELIYFSDNGGRSARSGAASLQRTSTSISRRRAGTKRSNAGSSRCTGTSGRPSGLGRDRGSSCFTDRAQPLSVPAASPRAAPSPGRARRRGRSGRQGRAAAGCPHGSRAASPWPGGSARTPAW